MSDSAYEYFLKGWIQTGKKDTAKVRSELARLGISDAELREMTRTIEPTRIAHRLNPKRTWMYSGEYDQVVPINNALALATSAKLSQSHHIRMATDHYSGILYLPLIVEEVAATIKKLK